MVDEPTDPLASSVPREVELVIEEAVLGEIDNSWTERIVRGGEGSQGVQMVAERLQLNMDMQMNHVVRDAEEGRNLWTGRVSGSHQGTTGRFTFMLEQTGSPEPITVLTAIWLVFFVGRGIYQTVGNCSGRAVEVCGPGRNKYVKNRRLLSTAAVLSGSVEDQCGIECS